MASNAYEVASNTMDHFEDFEERVEGEIDRTVEEAQNLAKKRVPVDTGQLRDDISADLEQDKIFNTLDYAVWQNFGTSHGIPPTWYMTDSALDAFNDSVRRLTQ